MRNRVLKKRAPVEGLPERLLDQRNVIRTVLGQQWWQAALLSVGRLVFDYLCLLFCVRAVGADPRPSLILLAYAVAGVIGLLPITPGGIGVVEASLAGFLALAGLTGAEAVLATLAYRLASYWLPMLAGPVAYGVFRYRYRDHGGPTPELEAHERPEVRRLSGDRPRRRGAGCRAARSPPRSPGPPGGPASVTLAQARRPSGVRQATTARSGDAVAAERHRVGLDGDLALGVGVGGALGERAHRGLGVGPGEARRRLDDGAVGQSVVVVGPGRPAGRCRRSRCCAWTRTSRARWRGPASPGASRRVPTMAASAWVP